MSDSTPPTPPQEQYADQSLDELIDLGRRYSARMKKLDDEYQPVRREILRRLQEIGFLPGQSYIRKDGVSVPVEQRDGREYIDRQALVLAGVDAETIDRATLKGEPSTPFVSIREPQAQGKKKSMMSAADVLAGEGGSLDAITSFVGERKVH